MKISSLQKGLVGHWTMAQDSLKGSLLADKTPYENDGTIYGATFATDRMGQPNKAMSFDGVDDYIDCGNKDSLDITSINCDGVTLAAWINISSYDSYAGIVGKRQRSTYNGYQLMPVFNVIDRICFDVFGKQVTASFTLNKWVFVVGTYDNNIMKLYIDGEEQPQTREESNLLVHSSSNVYIGKLPYGNFLINGSIDDVRIYNRALSETEIKTLYNSYNPNIKLSSLNKGLVAHWTMSQDSLKGALLADKTPYSNDGTIYGATFTTDRMGQPNKAMSFDGVNDYIDCGNDSSLDIKDNITISAWIKQSVGGTIQHIFARVPDSGDSIIYVRVDSNNKLQSKFRINGKAYGLPAGNIVLNQWNFVVVERFGNKINHYVNGVFVGSSPVAIGDIDTVQLGHQIGKAGWGNSEYFNGSIDDVRIYNRALSADEIKLLYETYKSKIKL